MGRDKKPKQQIKLLIWLGDGIDSNLKQNKQKGSS